MTHRGSSFSFEIGDGESEIVAIETPKTEAIRVRWDATGQPYDVNIRTSGTIPDALHAVAFSSLDPALPDDVTIEDTDTHNLATMNIKRTAYTQWTNNSGDTITITGRVDRHADEANDSPNEFVTRGPDGDVGERDFGFLDGVPIGLVQQQEVTRFIMYRPRESDPDAPSTGLRMYYRDDLDPSELRGISEDGTITTIATF